MSEGFIDTFRQRPSGWVKRPFTLYFESGDEARQWAKDHPGQAISPKANGDGFIANVLEWYHPDSGESYFDFEKEEYFAWAREQEQRKSAAGYASTCMGCHSRREGLWLYDNGHREMLLDLHRSYQESLKKGASAYDLHLVEKDLGEKLRALLPSPFPEDYLPR